MNLFKLFKINNSKLNQSKIDLKNIYLNSLVKCQYETKTKNKSMEWKLDTNYILIKTKFKKNRFKIKFHEKYYKKNCDISI